MTLIAAIRANQWPILLGDLLLSSPRPPSRRIALPTIGPLATPQAPAHPHYITGTAQKVCIVNPRLAVAWAGRQIYARDIIRELKSRFLRRKIDNDALKSFFLAQDTDYMQEMQFVCWYRNKSGLNSFGVNSVNIDTDGFGRCHVGGTGAGEFIELLYNDSKSHVSRGRPSVASQGIAHAMMLAGELISTEVLTERNLASYYGGGIEIATYVRGSYRKVGDVMHLFWMSDFCVSSNEIMFVPLVYKLDYLAEKLIIRRLEFSGDKIKKSDMFVVSSLLSNPSPKKLDLRRMPDLNASWLVNHIAVKDEKGRMSAKVGIHYSKIRKSPFQINETTEGINLSFDMSFFKNEFQSVFDGYGKFAGRSDS